MEYTVEKLSRLAGVSARTIRYYDQIGLLKPAYTNAAGYRLYGQAEIDRLQQILFYRELGVSLGRIKEIINSAAFNRKHALREHKEKLLAKRAQLDLLIANVDKTIVAMEGGISISDQEKFSGFKEKMIAENEAKYGAEIREKYGAETVDESNRKFLNMTKEEYNEFTKLEAEILSTLKKAFATGDPAGELGQKVADLHRQWLSFTWDQYSNKAHAGLARMYVDDPRFTAYYDREGPGLAEFLRDAILVYTGEKG